MAEGNNENNSSGQSNNNIKSSNLQEVDDENSVIPDLGIENVRGLDKKLQNAENQSLLGMNDTPKREENPFSFKHFLKRESNSYQNQGARPKIYTSSHPSTLDISHNVSTESHQPRLAPEFSSALPDFVQDHLVIEQCYLGTDTSPQDLTVDLDNLPDFTLNRNGSSRWQDSVRTNERRTNNTPSNLPLDLPARPRIGFPLDLPLTNAQTTNNRNSQPAEVGVSKSLPDFLSDGAVYSQPEESNSVRQSPERETDRLRRELELCRRQLIEQTRRGDQLQRQLEASRNKEHEYTHNLTKAMEQVEENLNISNRRAMTAENTVVKLKQEVKQLTAELAQLQKVNRNLRYEEGATGGPSYFPLDDQTQRFAQELRTAASTAEHSLRQLLTGVDNLRMMASSLENMHRIEEKSESFLSDLDEEAGPAL